MVKDIFGKITNWEAWPFSLIYAPLAPVWGWYMLRSRAVWFFTPSNPKLTFGGMEGEPKKEMYDLLPHHLYPTTINILPAQKFSEVFSSLNDSGIPYPLIVKPEMGGQGILFRKIDNEEELKRYHDRVPVEYIIQKMVHYPIEVSIFHIRHPRSPKGIVTGFLHKIPLQVLGDGVHTLEQLVMQHPKAAKRSDDLLGMHRANWNKIIPVNEKYVLSYAANHNRGAHFIDLKEHIDEKLVSVFDRISHDIDDFFYGRYDVMCKSIEELKRGENFCILEYNGCGAEPNHFYDTGYTLICAWREILKHWKWLFEISRYNAKRGIKPWRLKQGMNFLRKTKEAYRMMREADSRMGSLK